MATTGHTYGPSCLLYADSNTFTRRASEASIDPPPIKAHYFYCSVLPIDDPLSPVPPPPSGTTSKQKLPPRPFSVHDNAALEEVWLNLQDPGRRHTSCLPSSQGPSEIAGGQGRDPPAPSSFRNIARSYEAPPTKAESGSGVSKTENPLGKYIGAEGQQLDGADNKSDYQRRDNDMDLQTAHQAINSNDFESTRPLKIPLFGEKTLSHSEQKDEHLSKSASGVKGGTYTSQHMDEQTELTPQFDAPRKRRLNGRVTQPDLTLSDDLDHIPFDETMPVGSDEIGNDEFEGNLRAKRGRSPFRHSHKKEKERSNIKDESDLQDASRTKDHTSPYRRLSMKTNKAHDAKQKAQDTILGSSPAEYDITGTPFLRIPSRIRRTLSRSRSRSRSRPRSQALETSSGLTQLDDTGHTAEQKSNVEASQSGLQRNLRSQKDSERQDRQQQLETSGGESPNSFQEQSSPKEDGHQVHQSPKKIPKHQVTVGVSRLHVVEMPSLKMGPIYWDPVHDISSVVRGTWFYKETMWPVEADIANQIEEGYEYIKPWTLTYLDELNSCQEIGPAAELKLVNRLWPAAEPPGEGPRPAANRVREELLSTPAEQLDYKSQNRKNAISIAGSASNRAAGILDGYDDPVRLFNKCSMIYINGRDAQILRPSQLPSVARGRRPLAAMRKGRPIGVPVVRGFDFRAWEKLYPPSKVSSPKIARRGNQPEPNGRNMTNKSRQDPPCNACQPTVGRSTPSDLVLVIHGIGQKLSERVESFNFTHSINAFRRAVNMELETSFVNPCLRAGLGGIMVLPINWRSKIELEDGKPESNPNRKDTPGSTRNEFSLKDITEESIPAVRNLISDVLLDIPYYLSHHKPRMIAAVIKEANRVYRLWCINNPDFHETGRVHILAHSLGSVMTLDILSKQPTNLPKQLDFKLSKVRSDIFEFDTKNLFFAGSPAGLFLYINRAPLVPRHGRGKPDANGEDSNSRITGEAGTYGCLAIDNLYNIIHYIDPIAYRLNAAVDVNYAASLRTAELPSAADTWAQYFGFRGATLMPSAPPHALINLNEFSARPSVPSMPSTVELEIHNFTREEIAEKRMLLMNDNGQIDYTLRSGGGPLEIQYLNMLGAHSSYWTTPEFVRFLVVEVGRKPGKGGTVSTMKAVKKARRKK